jgi:hypothetical protein
MVGKAAAMRREHITNGLCGYGLGQRLAARCSIGALWAWVWDTVLGFPGSRRNAPTRWGGLETAEI